MSYNDSKSHTYMCRGLDKQINSIHEAHDVNIRDDAQNTVTNIVYLAFRMFPARSVSIFLCSLLREPIMYSASCKFSTRSRLRADPLPFDFFVFTGAGVVT